eukprot:GFYU01007958.1.p1 GENE.GFYU01007958.1~~GFYU01007958.1.p1  ORF type:complete len:158 (-),score=16.56 GFYU01007958.1:54-527(-)
MKIKCEGWYDGEKQTLELEEFDRWTVQEADTLEIDLDTVTIKIKQHPKANWFGCYIWDTAIILSKYLETIPAAKLHGARVVELGAGVGLVGICACLLGADVTLTDLDEVMPILRENVEYSVQGRYVVRLDTLIVPGESAHVQLTCHCCVMSLTSTMH